MSKKKMTMKMDWRSKKRVLIVLAIGVIVIIVVVILVIIAVTVYQSLQLRGIFAAEVAVEQVAGYDDTAARYDSMAAGYDDMMVVRDGSVAIDSTVAAGDDGAAVNGVTAAEDGNDTAIAGDGERTRGGEMATMKKNMIERMRSNPGNAIYDARITGMRMIVLSNGVKLDLDVGGLADMEILAEQVREMSEELQEEVIEMVSRHIEENWR